MSFAKVVLGLPVEGPFDYLVPERMAKMVKAGTRVWVHFGTRRMLGYVVGLSKKSEIKKVKPLLELIDKEPILGKNMLTLTRKLADYYCCSWGEAIETALPEGLRKGRPLPQIPDTKNHDFIQREDNPDFDEATVLIHALDKARRWEIYTESIRETLGQNKGVILLSADMRLALKAQELINSKLNSASQLLYRKQPKELETWIEISRGKVSVVIGTRSAIFAPLSNLGLIIIDEEQDFVYKQDQVPHYHAREVALMRAGIEGAGVILGSSAPSLESFCIGQKDKGKYIFIPRTKAFPEIEIVDMKNLSIARAQRSIIFSRYLEDAIASALDAGGRILLFSNRAGFATVATCRSCGIVLKCSRCNINLVYHFKEKLLSCHYCNFKMEAPAICPHCNAGYIQYTGIGTEKIESELSLRFPQARIKRWSQSQEQDILDADILISTQAIIKEGSYNFDLIGVLAIDNALNRVDLRASEKAFALLVELSELTEKRMIVQTRTPGHYCFLALTNKDTRIFYEEELRQRKELNLPPYRHLGLVKLRGRKEERVRQAAYALFENLNRCKSRGGIKIISVTAGQPTKLRGNFYWQVLLRSDSPYRMSRFLKNHLKDFRHSGIIVTVDIDPL